MKISKVIQEIYSEAIEISEPFGELSVDEKLHAQGLLARFEELETAHGKLPYSEVLRPMLLSKNGRHDEALAVTERQYQATPNWESAIAVANAARRAGDLEYAVEMFTKAAGHDSEDEACWLEIGDIRLEQGQLSESLKAYETVLTKDPIHQWALPSAFYCRHLLGLKGNWAESLREVALQEECTCGLDECLTSLFGTYGSETGMARAEYLLGKINNP